MHAAFSALLKAVSDLRDPRVLALALLPPLAAIVVWIALAWVLADDWARWVADWIATTSWLGWVSDWGLSSVAIWGSGIAAIALLLPIMLVTAVLVTELVAMPVIVPLVARRDYPRLAENKGGTIAGSIWNAVAAVTVFAVLWLFSLPLWFTGIGALVLPPLISAWFNQRMFRYDALAEHASPAEREAIVRGARGRLFALGFLLALMYYIPFVNLAVPVLSGLAFTHLCLAELARLRGGTRLGTRDQGMGTGA
jgi:CysZ protein